uniref:Uncharacterized protein AlNc14C28G2698 n=1 Tax=Albugo laibachii Nc14 TaxID=890382 RepID=F0W770_9STRA|nr:conserved hypothetical protein [Albugo laibachii Nc14]|eukprot:CCA16969.1 conserved hypothetical protein [Albugo laibachii Nc14]
MQAIRCQTCEHPSRSEIPFCAAFIPYSTCKTKLSWNVLDKIAQQSYMRIISASPTSTKSNDSLCTQSIQQIQCARYFSVCELGTSQLFCRSDCQNSLEANCTSHWNSAQLNASLEHNVCGNDTYHVGGIVSSGKCFKLAYNGPERSAWVLGFSIAIIFSFLASVGINLQKKALKQNELSANEHEQEPLPVYRLPLWVIGFVLIVAGSILDFVAFGLAPQSLLAPLAALTLVWNMMLAPCFNKEKLECKDIVATLVIFAGATLAVVFASHTTPSYTLTMLLALYENVLTCGYFAFVIVCIVLHYGMIKAVETCNLNTRQHHFIEFGTPAFWTRIRMIGYAGLAGTLGGQSVLFAKSCAELLKSSMSGDSPFKHFETYAFIIALFVCLLFQVHFLNCGLLHFDALLMVPVYQAYWIVSSVLGGAIYFQEIRSFSVVQAACFVIGITTTIGGVILLSQRKIAPASTRKKPGTTHRENLTVKSNSSSHSIGSVSSDGQSRVLPLSGVGEGDITSDKNEEMDQVRCEECLTKDTEDEESKENECEDDLSSSETHDASRVSRQAIENYFDMSAGTCITELLDGLGLSRASHVPLHLCRPQARIPRGTVDDIEVGMPASRSDVDDPTPKRRSITFTVFQRSKHPSNHSEEKQQDSS